jgi:hypothetical protein
VIAQQNLFEAAEARAKAGMETAVEHADRVEPDWSTDAYEALKTMARTHAGHTFTIEELRLRIGPWLPEPPDLRAWGAVVQLGIRHGWLRKTGIYAPRASGNGTPTMTYTYGGRP